MESINKIRRLNIVLAACIAVLALFGAAGCDEEGVIGAIGSGEIGNGLGGGDFNYTFTENRDDGTSNSFSFNSGISAHESLETYLSGSIVY